MYYEITYLFKFKVFLFCMCPWVTKNLSSKYLILGELSCILCTVALGALGEMRLWNVVTIGLNNHFVCIFQLLYEGSQKLVWLHLSIPVVIWCDIVGDLQWR